MLHALYEKAKTKRVKKECEEKENPYVDYVEHIDEPWVFHERGVKRDLWKRGRQDYERTNVYHPKRTDANYWADFKPPPMDVMVADFFIDSGKPRLNRLGQYVEKWLVWAVTRGFYRMDQNKKMFTFKGVDPTILHFQSSKGFWERVDFGEGFPILRDITETCNRLYGAVLGKLSWYKSKSPYYKNTMEHLIALP